MQVNRFNVSCCIDVFADDPEFDTLFALAATGVTIDTEEGFIPTTVPDPIRPMQKRMSSTITSHVLRLLQT